MQNLLISSMQIAKPKLQKKSILMIIIMYRLWVLERDRERERLTEATNCGFNIVTPVK